MGGQTEARDECTSVVNARAGLLRCTMDELAGISDLALFILV